MEDKFSRKPHCLHLENRCGLKLTGVTDIGSFDEENVTAYTDYGCLSVSGSNLHVEELNVANGILEINGEVTALIYSSKTSKEKTIFKRLFGACFSGPVFDMRIFNGDHLRFFSFSQFFIPE